MSIGVARTKHLAKIASQVAKPDGLVVVDPARELAFLHDLPVELMWGVGPATRASLAAAGVTTIGQLARSSTSTCVAGLSVAAILLFTRFWRNSRTERWRRTPQTSPT